MGKLLKFLTLPWHEPISSSADRMVDRKWHKLLSSSGGGESFALQKSCFKIFLLQGRDKVLQYPKLFPSPFVGFRLLFGKFLDIYNRVSLSIIRFFQSHLAIDSRIQENNLVLHSYLHIFSQNLNRAEWKIPGRCRCRLVFGGKFLKPRCNLDPRLSL